MTPVDAVFQRRLLPLGQLRWLGELADCTAIQKTALLTVEGELDDISAPGQTMAAHDLCSSLPESKQANHLQKGVGHYGIFNGRRWREIIAPQVKAFIAKHDRPSRARRAKKKKAKGNGKAAA